MTFKIDSAGFYKNRKGERIKIEGRSHIRAWLWYDSATDSYTTDGCCTLDYPEKDIISKWVETPELEDFAVSNVPLGKSFEAPSLVLDMCECGKLKFTEPSTEKPSVAPKFYLVFNPQQSAPKHQHKTLEEAKAEAKCIAAKYPKQKVYVLETIACYTASVDVQEVGVV